MDSPELQELSRSSPPSRPPSGDHETLMENMLDPQKQLRSPKHDRPDSSDASEVGRTAVEPSQTRIAAKREIDRFRSIARKRKWKHLRLIEAHNHGQSGNLYKWSEMDSTISSQTSSVGIPFSGDSIELSSKSSIENLFTPEEMEFTLSDEDLKSDHKSGPFPEDLKSVPLPKDLKWYFSLFPLHYEFDKDSLIQLWIAEGFIMNGLTERMEDLGSVFFSCLLDEEFIVSSGYKYKVNEAKIGERLMFDCNKLDDIPANSRHLSLLSATWTSIIVLVKKCQLLSTLHLFPYHDSCIKHIPRDFFLSLKGLCVLNLSQSDILEIPSSIGSMTSLLYLDISKTLIKWLPESIGFLQKLQTLKLRYCFNLLGLPKAIKKLINLRHLDLDVVRQLNSMPAGLRYLINIQTLSAFIIGEYDGCRIGELKNLNNLSGEFCLVRLENVVDSSEALEAALWDKRYLQKLELKWSDSCSQTVNGEEKLIEYLKTQYTVNEEEELLEYLETHDTVNEEEKLLEYLKPHDNLQELKICFYGGSKLPNWISNPSFFKLVSISFYKCRNCEFLPSIGTLPSLKFLYINEMNCVKEINRYFFKNDPDHVGCAFPKLENLSIDVMLGLEEWKKIELGDLSCLRKLTMRCCPKLVTLPSFSGLDSLKHLEIIDCPKLPSLLEALPTSLEFLLIKDCPILKERCSSLRGKDWQKVSHVPYIWIDREEISSQI